LEFKNGTRSTGRFTVKCPGKKESNQSVSTLVSFATKKFGIAITLNKSIVVQMEAKNFQLEVVKERWPEHKDDILSLYYRDNKFRAIVEDYYLAIQHLDKFRKQFSEKLESIEEYEKVLHDLEIELRDRIAKK
jgi:DNA repair ATPase RecN